ncbi:MAG: hypothetical protein WCH43_04435 [Verrucomicrobiota bacterium]
MPATTGTGVHGQSITSGQFVIGGAVTTVAEWAGEIDIQVTQYNGVNITPVWVPTFCIQLSQNVSLNTSYTTYLVKNVASGDEGTLTATAVRDLTTLYYLFYQGNNSSNWDTTTATAFQLDCWKITSNPGNYTISGSSTGGTFYDNGWLAGGSAVTLAQTWLSQVSGTVVAGGGSTQPMALTNGTYQDLIYTQTINNSFVPFGIKAWPGAVLLGVIVFLRGKRRLKTAG